MHTDDFPFTRARETQNLPPQILNFSGVCRTHLGLRPRDKPGSPTAQVSVSFLPRAHRADRLLTPVTLAPQRPSDDLIGQAP